MWSNPSQGQDLFLGCRKGDLDAVKYLMEEKEINPNLRDRWDSTPLYYACLCGHFELVQYLLENGARCDASTFDGERCIYGALTDEIRKALLKFSVITSRVKRRDHYQEFLRRLLEDGIENDVTFQVHNTAFHAHKAILCARSRYFDEQFQGRWSNKRVVGLKNSMIDSQAFKLILEWLYTAQVKIDVALLEDVQRLARQCKLEQLEADLEAATLKADNFVQSKRGMKIQHVQVESLGSEATLESDLRCLASLGMPRKLRPSEVEGLSQPAQINPFFDVIFKVEGQDFQGHRAILSARSDFFRALIQDHFHEGSYSTAEAILSIPIHNIQAEVFGIVIAHIYSNSQELQPHNVYEVLEAADLCLLNSLKRQCGNYLGQYLETDNVINLVQTARLFALPRLEHQCTEFITIHIEEMVHQRDFRDLVVHDANLVLERQETDSIDVIDEIRFCLKTDLNSISAIEEAARKLDLITDMLGELGFDV